MVIDEKIRKLDNYVKIQIIRAADVSSTKQNEKTENALVEWLIIIKIILSFIVNFDRRNLLLNYENNKKLESCFVRDNQSLLNRRRFAA